jgi:hypothetical protein
MGNTLNNKLGIKINNFKIKLIEKDNFFLFYLF